MAKDLDAIRAGLGDEKLTYLGYSYGTRIGALYAEAYPDKVRAMLLDGAVDPNADQIEEEIRQAAAFQKAFDNFAADCARAPTARWAPTPPRPWMCTRALSIRWSSTLRRRRTPAALRTATRLSGPSFRCTRRACGGT